MKSIRNILISIFLLPVVFLASAQNTEPLPLFSFGVIADVQYADAGQTGKRDYRGSLQKLAKSVEIFNRHDLSFIVHLGDLIDRHYESFDLPLGILSNSRAPVHYAIGNHEFAVADSLKQNVRSLLNNPRGYYSFVENEIQFILVDAMDVSLMASVRGSRDYRQALAIQQGLKNGNANNAYEWNGAIGKRQLRWIKRQLRQGEKKGLKTILFSHHPLLPENGLQMWNNREVIGLLNKYPSVVAFFSGHHHEGGYVKSGDIHYLTFKGLVEASSEIAVGIAEVFSDRIVIKGFGDQSGYMLDYP